METLDLSWDDEEGGFFLKDINELIARIAEAKDTVKILKITGQPELTEIPAIVGECKPLEELDISWNSIKEIPDFVFTLPALRSLYCQYNDIIDLPAIAKAAKLETLSITVKNDKSIPEEIGALSKLKNLNLLIEETGEITLPASFANHPALRKIAIKNLAWGDTKTTLDLDSTAKILASCPNLESLVLRRIHAKMGNNGFALPVQLKELELWNCTFDINPFMDNPFKAIESLHNLRVLKISNIAFDMDELPDIFNGLPELREFYCESYVQKLPPSIYCLSKLERLTLNCTAITELDEKTGNLHNLKQIMLGNNMLETLPESIFSLPNLKKLDISTNNFSKKEIAAIKNKIKAIPSRKIKLSSGGQGPSETKKFTIMQHNAARQSIAPLHDVEPYKTITDPYYTQYLAAVKEDWRALLLVDKRIRAYAYSEICKAAAKKCAIAISHIEVERLDNFIKDYEFICLAALDGEGANDSIDSRALKKIRDDLFSYINYVKFCLKVVTHNNGWSILEGINHERLSREDYLHICWVSILHWQPTIAGVLDPPEELCMFALKCGAYLTHIPEQARSYEICSYAVQINKLLNIDEIPEQHRDAAMLSLFEEAKAKREEAKKKAREIAKRGQEITMEIKTAEEAMAAVQQCGRELRHVPENLKTAELCLAAVQQDGIALKHVPEKLKTAELCFTAVQRYGYALACVPEKFKTAELCFAAVQRNGVALEKVPEHLKTVELCLTAVRQYGKALKFVPKALQAQIAEEAGISDNDDEDEDDGNSGS